MTWTIWKHDKGGGGDSYPPMNTMLMTILSSFFLCYPWKIYKLGTNARNMVIRFHILDMVAPYNLVPTVRFFNLPNFGWIIHRDLVMLCEKRSTTFKPASDWAKIGGNYDISTIFMTQGGGIIDPIFNVARFDTLGIKNHHWYFFHD